MGTNARPFEAGVRAPATAARLLWGVTATALAVLYTALLALAAAALAALNRPRAANTIARLWGKLIIGTCGVKVEMEGLENLSGIGSCVLVANHQSFFDIFALFAYFPGAVRFVAKKELLKIPLIAYALKNAEHIVIDREAGGAAIRKALRVMRLGRAICIFAEGGRFSDNRVHEFRDGAAWLAIAARAPCVPLAFSGTAAIFPRKARVVVPGRKMRMTFGPPISAAQLRNADRAELTQRLEQAVRAAFVPEP